MTNNEKRYLAGVCRIYGIREDQAPNLCGLKFCLRDYLRNMRDGDEVRIPLDVCTNVNVRNTCSYLTAHSDKYYSTENRRGQSYTTVYCHLKDDDYDRD